MAQRRVQQWVMADGVGATRNGVLMALPKDGSTRPLGELGPVVGLSASSLSGLIDRMSLAGLLERIPAPADGRSFLVRLTEQGREARRAAIGQAQVLNSKLTEGFTQTELATVERWLQAAADRFSKEEQ